MKITLKKLFMDVSSFDFSTRIMEKIPLLSLELVLFHCIFVMVSFIKLTSICWKNQMHTKSSDRGNKYLHISHKILARRLIFSKTRVIRENNVQFLP